jgi:hypothetical protein
MLVRTPSHTFYHWKKFYCNFFDLWAQIDWTIVHSQQSELWTDGKILRLYWAIPFNIRTPPVEDRFFHSYTPQEFPARIPLPLKNSRLKTLYPWRIPSSEKFRYQTSLPLKNSNLKTLYPWRIPTQNPLPLKNSNLKTLYPWRIPTQNPLPMKNSTLKTLYPWRIPSSKSFTPEEFQTQYTLPLKNSI